MEKQERPTASIFDISLRTGLVILFVAVTTSILAAPVAQAQTFQVIYNFTGGQDGSGPEDGLTMDAYGHLYGTASAGGHQVSGCENFWGNYGCGTVFRLTYFHSHWLFGALYQFQGGADANPSRGVVIGPDGALYGLTAPGNCNSYQCGGLYRLAPPPTQCAAVYCAWRETVLHQFTGQPDGSFPSSRVLFDNAGNMYGLTYFGGAYNSGAIYELTGNGGWQESVIYSFNSNGGLSAGLPEGEMVLDQAGNLYGTADCNQNMGCFYGEVWQLQPSQSGWNLNPLYQFNGNNGYQPVGLIRDASGNLYGPTFGAFGNESGTIYELTPNGDSWAYTLVHDFGLSDLANGLVMDSAGNIYGADFEYGYGYIFKLTPTAGGWMFTTLHTFSGPDGEFPQGQIVIDSNGNLYGTTIKGGTYGLGVVWEITP